MEGAESITKIESENFKLQNDKYLLEMALYSDDFIEFKITQNSPTASCYYIEKFNFEKITDISNLNSKKLDMKKVYHIYQRILKNEKINIILSQDKNIITINYKISANYEEEDVNLELKKMELEKEDIIDILKKEVEKNEKKMEELQKENEKMKKENENMKKDIDLLMGEYNKKIEKEKEAEEREKQLQKEEEELSSKNDNLNLINYFKCDNIKQMQYIDTIIYLYFDFNTVAVYCIIKNNKTLYQMTGSFNNNSKYYIIIYDLVNKKRENLIYIGETYINKIKHYYNPSDKMHMLLCFGGNVVQIWDISSNPSTKISNIENISSGQASCLIFKDNRFFIFGIYSQQSEYNLVCWDQNGNQVNNNINIYGSPKFMETTYIENKTYILMDGYDSESRLYFAQCYDYDNNKVYYYKNKNDKSSSDITCINLFNKGNKIEDIDLIVCKKDKIEVFNFKNKNFMREISIKDNYCLCTLNQKYIVVNTSNKIKIIDNNYSFLNEEYHMLSEVKVIRKIKIPEIGECILTFIGNIIEIWKI